MEKNISQGTRKQRADKGKPRGCRWTDSYKSIRLRLSDDLYNYAQEHKGEKSLNQFLNDALRAQFFNI